MNQEQVNQLFAAMTTNGFSQEEATSILTSLIQQKATMEQATAWLQGELAKRNQPAPQVAVQTPVAAAVTTAAVGVSDLLAIANMAAESDDHGVIRAGFEPAAKGPCSIRLRSYIEVGVHKPSNPTHKNREMVHLVFEVNSAKHMRKIDGVDTPHEIVVRVPKAHSGNAGFPRLFSALNACHGDKYHHIGQMLGECWLATIYHSDADSNGRIYENFDKDKAWSFAATSGFNLDSTPYSVQVPPLMGEPQFFVFDNASVTDPATIKRMWDSIYIAGERVSQKADGTTTTTSKNYFQEILRASVTWEESATFKALSTQCSAETIAPIRKAQTAQSNTVMPQTTPQLGAQPVVQQPVVQPAVQPVVQQPLVEPQLTPSTVQPVVQPTVQPTGVVSVAPNFTPPPTVGEQVAAQPTVVAELQTASVQPEVIVGNSAPSVDNFLAQFKA